MNTTTVAQVSALRAAFEKLDGWQELVPDFGSTFITAGRGDKGTDADIYATGDTYVTGAVTPDGRLAVVYLPSATSQTISIDQSKMAPGYTARWVDPTTGASTPAATGATSTTRTEPTQPGTRTGCSCWESSAPGSSR